MGWGVANWCAPFFLVDRKELVDGIIALVRRGEWEGFVRVHLSRGDEDVDVAIEVPVDDEPAWLDLGPEGLRGISKIDAG